MNLLYCRNERISKSKIIYSNLFCNCKHMELLNISFLRDDLVIEQGAVV